MKPVEPARLVDMVAHPHQRLRASGPLPEVEALLIQRASVAQTMRMTSVDEIDHLRSDEKYTTIAWRGDRASPAKR